MNSTRNPFSPFHTALYVGAWSLVMLLGWGAHIGSNPAARLGDPVNTAQRIIVRNLELAEVNQRAGPLHSFRSALFGSYKQTLDASIAIQRDTSDASTPGVESKELVQSNTALCVLLAEAGEFEEAFDLAQQLPAEIEDALRTIYASAALDDAQAPEPDLRALDSLAEAGLSDWLLERPTIRLLEHSGGADSKAAISAISIVAQKLEQRGTRWRNRTEALTAANYLLIAAGVALLAAMALGSAQKRSPAPSVVPWSLSLGLAVLVRADFWNRIYFVILAELATIFPEAEWLGPFYAYGTLFASLPLLWLIHRHLLASSQGALLRTFGLNPTRVRVGSILFVATAALSIDLLGTTALAWGSWALGFESHWAEGLDEILIWGSTREVIQSCIDYLLFTPVFEELLFRGLLFYTLRNRYGPWQAAAMSAGLFSAVHFYSLPGFLMTFWSGFVWAIAFERARSLLPGIVAHSVYNLFYVLGILLVYR